MNPIAEQVMIRPYAPQDRPGIRKISYDTSFLGKADELFDEPELLADALTLYFTDSEPQSCFVAEEKGVVVGYLIGAKNEREMETVSWVKIYPRLFWVAIIRGLFFRYKTFRFLRGVIASAFKSEFRAPDFSQEYPAILHINIAKDFRGGGIGAKLIQVYCEYLKKNGVRAVRAATMSEPAKNFFEHCGFRVLFMTRRSYLHYYFRKDIPVYILGKQITKPI